LDPNQNQMGTKLVYVLIVMLLRAEGSRGPQHRACYMQLRV